jgi:hypothetical protein
MSCTQSLPALETRRAELLRSIADLKDMRPGSIVGAVFRCGKPGCHCALPDDPGHGPHLRLTHLVEVSERVCRLRPVTDTLSPEEKKRPKRSVGRSDAK